MSAQGGSAARAPISRFALAPITDLPRDLRERIAAVQEKAGFVPNVFLALAHRPLELRAFMDYHDALLLRASGLSKGEKEMIVVATSGLNHCLYCVVAHGAILRVYEKNAYISDQLSTNWRKADLTARQRAMLAFAVKVSRDAESLGDEDYADLTAHGFSDDDTWDIGAIAAFFGMSNRLANMSAMRPNEEFFAMGRLPKASQAAR